MTEVTFDSDSGFNSPVYWYKKTAQAPGSRETADPDEVEVPLADIVASSRVRSGLPIPAVPQLPEWQHAAHRQRTSFHGVSAVDGGGRLNGRRLLDVLGWKPGDPLQAHLRDGLIVFGPGEPARFHLRRDGNLRIPAGLCHVTGVLPGDRVLMTADTHHRRLIVFPQHVLDAMVIRQLTVEEDGAAK
ncbi:hypothetical protein HLB23_14085 [Nocardia uniformis]|uniref:Uncharacterized protein n=1 Tax=Nocardia uniformis TaxID=53432 RepID=A0A849C052_9NOCA|nr:hypothetical protein [Nocardia uniformis]NNH70978.1 hypothetical protein [Nocardia uniformis]